ncbi:MAG: hypothetical protein GQ557_00565 [Mycoplasmataceae bacterium]|nr:hypothetical protein [Mycoplasmataceae bacterium]
MKKISFQEFQSINIESFSSINDEIISLNIKWWAHSGTLLGAIRDEKIIPWDDDIDMAMSIVDFYKYKSKLQEIANKYNYELIDRLEHWGLDVCRLIYNEKYIVEFDNSEYISSPHIDIMLAIPVKKKISKLKSFNWSMINNLSFIYNSPFPLPKYGWKFKKLKKIHWYENLIVLIFKILFFPLFLMIPLQNIWLKRKKHLEYENLVLYYNYNSLQIQYIKKNLIQIPFHNTLIYCDFHYKNELNKRYGVNWKTPVSDELKIPHHLLLTPAIKNLNYSIKPFIII